MPNDESTPISLDVLQQQVKQRLSRMMPRPAGASPSVDRAVAALEGEYPDDMRGVNVTVNPWSDPWSGTNTLATTGVTPGETEHIRLNPALTTAFPQETTQGVLAHELQHVRQNRTEGDPLHRASLEALLPYGDRPDEKDAFKAQADYIHSHNIPDVSYPVNPFVLRALPKSPLVK